MTTDTEHPSHFALDSARLGGITDESLRAHIAGCARCRAHMETTRDPRPAWLTGVELAPRRRRWRPTFVFLPMALAAAAVLIVVRPAPTPEHTSVREKGSTEIVVHVRRDGRVSTWDGRSAIRPGDSLRLRVVGGARFTHVSIAALGRRAPVVLHEGAFDGRGDALLPVSFRVDAEPGDEVLSVVLARTPIAPSFHTHAGGSRPEQDRHRQILVFPKQLGPDGSTRSAP